ncbi:MAG: pyridoxamine 5'-phosphate oxidase family protein [Thermomicrobiales bacterium]
MPPRTASQRRKDTLDTLQRVRDVWVASASETGDAYLIPLSYVWDGDRLTMATPEASKTTRNLARAGWARLALPSTDDVVILEGPIEIIPLNADDALAADHAAAAGFDPRQESEPYVYMRVTPQRIQAWRDAAELSGRTIMREGRWVAD